MTLPALFAAASLLACFLVLMCGMLLAAEARALMLRRRAARAGVVLPVIQTALIDYVSGSNDLTRLQELARRHPDEFPLAVTSLEGALSGSSFDRLCALTLGFSLLHDWMEQTHSRDPLRRRNAYYQLAFVSRFDLCRREVGALLLHAIDDPDPDIRVAASRAILHSGSPEEIEAVFRMAISQTRLVRVVLAEDLRRSAALLCQKAVPEALNLADPGQIAAALELLTAWERAIPVADLDKLVGHPDRRVRMAALRLAPMVGRSAENDSAVIAGLHDADPEVARAAADAARRMRLAESVPVLARLVRTGTATIARAAAAALAGMPPRGRAVLEELKAYPGRTTAAAAAEALAAVDRKATV